MNKSELVDAIAEETQLPKKTIDTVLSSQIAVIQRTVAQGEDVALVGFGTFKRNLRQARTGRHPKTGEPMQIPQSQVPSFSAGKKFREEVNPAPVAKELATAGKKK